MPSAQPWELMLVQNSLTLDSEDDLKLIAMIDRARRRGQEPEVVVLLVRTGSHPQRIEREAGIPDPGESIVPIPRTPRRLR